MTKNTLREEEEESLDLGLIGSNLNRGGSLIGSSMAVFTFLLFFFVPRMGQIDATLYQLTLFMIILTIFSFAFSGLYYYGILGIPKMDVQAKRKSVRRGDSLFVLGIILAVTEPALILFTIGLVVVGTLAGILWLVFTIFVVRQARHY